MLRALAYIIRQLCPNLGTRRQARASGFIQWNGMLAGGPAIERQSYYDVMSYNAGLSMEALSKERKNRVCSQAIPGTLSQG